MAKLPWLLPPFFTLNEASPEWAVALSTLVVHGFSVGIEKNPKAEGIWLFSGSSDFQEKEKKWLKKIPEDARKVMFSAHPEALLAFKNTYVITGHPARSLLLLAKALSTPVSPFLDHIPGLAFNNMLQKVTVQSDELTRDFPILSAGLPLQTVHLAQWVTTGFTQKEWLPMSPLDQVQGIMVWVGHMPPASHPHWRTWQPKGLTHLWWPQVTDTTQAESVRAAWPDFKALGFHAMLATTAELSFLPEAQWLTLPSTLFSVKTSSTAFHPDALPWVVVPSGKNLPQVLCHQGLFRALGGNGNKTYATSTLSAKIARRFGPEKKSNPPWWKFWAGL
jgi:hypothetical protein